MKTALPAKSKQPTLLWAEKATGVAQAAQPGLLPARTATPLTLFLTILLTLVLSPSQGLYALPIALIFARLAALDATTYTLPNLYTVPLIAIGMAYAITHLHLATVVLVPILGLCLSLILSRSQATKGVGGGDIKLLVALFLFQPAEAALLALGLASVLYLPLACLAPKCPVPFGLPILLAWVLLLGAPTLPNWLFSTIS